MSPCRIPASCTFGRTDMKVLIVGAGVAGLGLANSLAQRDIVPTVVEKNDSIGGNSSLFFITDSARLLTRFHAHLYIRVFGHVDIPQSHHRKLSDAHCITTTDGMRVACFRETRDMRCEAAVFISQRMMLTGGSVTLVKSAYRDNSLDHWHLLQFTFPNESGVDLILTPLLQ